MHGSMVSTIMFTSARSAYERSSHTDQVHALVGVRMRMRSRYLVPLPTGVVVALARGCSRSAAGNRAVGGAACGRAFGNAGDHFLDDVDRLPRISLGAHFDAGVAVAVVRVIGVKSEARRPPPLAAHVVDHVGRARAKGPTIPRFTASSCSMRPRPQTAARSNRSGERGQILVIYSS